jgi:hypothetical protein
MREKQQRGRSRSAEAEGEQPTTKATFSFSFIYNACFSLCFTEGRKHLVGVHNAALDVLSVVWLPL